MYDRRTVLETLVVAVMAVRGRRWERGIVYELLLVAMDITHQSLLDDTPRCPTAPTLRFVKLLLLMWRVVRNFWKSSRIEKVVGC